MKNREFLYFYTSKIVFHNTTPHLQDQDLFLVSDRSCPKTDVLRPHHCFLVKFGYTLSRWCINVTENWSNNGRTLISTKIYANSSSL